MRKKSGKKAGGQEDHTGATLMWHACPDEVIVHPVTCCDHCQHDLQAVKPLQIVLVVVDVPAPRLLVHEHQTERKQCPDCQRCAHNLREVEEHIKATLRGHPILPSFQTT